eukprot:10251975-Ditylum_brightwellii.AAC.1
MRQSPVPTSCNYHLDIEPSILPVVVHSTFCNNSMLVEPSMLAAVLSKLSEIKEYSSALSVYPNMLNI